MLNMTRNTSLYSQTAFPYLQKNYKIVEATYAREIVYVRLVVVIETFRNWCIKLLHAQNNCVIDAN